MATYLYKLGRWSYDRRRLVVGLWLAVLVAVGACAAAFSGQTNNKFEVPGTESQQAQELLEQRYPEASGTYARVVFAAPEGESLNEGSYKAGVDATLAEASKAAEVSQVSKLTTTEDGRIGYADVVYPVPSSEIWPSASTTPCSSSRAIARTSVTACRCASPSPRRPGPPARPWSSPA